MVLVDIIWSPFHQAVPPAKLTISHSKPAKFNVATRNSAQLFVLKCFHPTKKMHFVNFVAFSHISYKFPNYISSWQTAIWIWLLEKTVPKVRSETSRSFATLRWWSGASCEGSRGPGSATYLERTCCSCCVWCSMLCLCMRVFFMHIIDYQIGLWLSSFFNPSDSEYSWRWKVSPTEWTVIVMVFGVTTTINRDSPNQIFCRMYTHTHTRLLNTGSEYFLFCIDLPLHRLADLQNRFIFVWSGYSNVYNWRKMM